MGIDASPQAGRIGVISDAICPWCYVGKRQLERALRSLAEDGLHFSVHWHAYQLNPAMPREGAERSSYRIAKFGSAARAAALEQRVVEAAAALGLAFRPELIERVPNTVDAHRLVWFAGREGTQDEMVERLFRGYFIEGRDIGDPEVLTELAGEAGLDRDAVAGALTSQEGRADVLAEDEAARRAGLDGVPTFTLDGHVMFSGAQPAVTMAEALRRAVAILRGRAA